MSAPSATLGAMISHDRAEGRFNLRAGAIILRDGYVLIHRAHFDSFRSLPGGRVEWGEASTETLAREIVEELGVTGRVARLAAVIENFFVIEGRPWHEIASYHLVELGAGFPFEPDEAICHRVQDGAAELEFKWVAARPDRLTAHDLMPAPLRALVSDLPDHPVHIVERNAA